MKKPPVNPNYSPPTTTATRPWGPLKPISEEVIRRRIEREKGIYPENSVRTQDEGPLYGLPFAEWTDMTE
jgi:hypothetical protein